MNELIREYQIEQFSRSPETIVIDLPKETTKVMIDLGKEIKALHRTLKTLGERRVKHESNFLAS